MAFEVTHCLPAGHSRKAEDNESTLSWVAANYLHAFTLKFPPEGFPLFAVDLNVFYWMIRCEYFWRNICLPIAEVRQTFSRSKNKKNMKILQIKIKK